jgi:hypothetical protein
MNKEFYFDFLKKNTFSKKNIKLRMIFSFIFKNYFFKVFFSFYNYLRKKFNFNKIKKRNFKKNLL